MKSQSRLVPVQRHTAANGRLAALRRQSLEMPRRSPAPSFAIGLIRIVAIVLFTCGTAGALDAAPTSASLPNGPASTSLTQGLKGFFTRIWSPGTSDAEKLGTAYVYDEDGSLLSETGTGGANSTGAVNYIYLPTAGGPMPVVAEINGQLYAVHSDHLNTPRRLTTSQGQPAWQWAYSAFGDEEPTTAKNRFANLALTPNPGTTGITDIVFNVGFMGMYRDSESGLAQNWNRYFDRRLGRYTQPDRIGLDGGPNRYPYANLNPLKFMDPSGLWALTLEGYNGLGGGVVFGRDPSTGGLFVSGRVGVGWGGGGSWDPNGGRPGGGGARSCAAGVGGGLFGWTGANVGPLQGSISGNVGTNYNIGASPESAIDFRTGDGVLVTSPDQPYGEMSPSWSLGNSWGTHLGGAIGAEGTIFRSGR